MNRSRSPGFLVLLILFLISFIGTSIIINSGREEYTKVIITSPSTQKNTNKDTDDPTSAPKEVEDTPEEIPSPNITPEEEANTESPPEKEPVSSFPKEEAPKEESSKEPSIVTPKHDEEKPKEDSEEDTKQNIGKKDQAGQKMVLKDYETRFEEIFKADGTKTAYLTFDDGPSAKVTPQILDILNSYGLKATFFVVGNQVEYNKNILKRVYEEGHAIGLHSYSHDYNEIYSNLEAFKNDFIKVEQLVKSTLGQDFSTRIYRFPGGSFGSNKDIFKQYINEIGYHYIDWNTLTGDSEYIVDANGKKVVRSDPKQLFERFKETLRASPNKEDLVVLMHDLGSKQGTVDALPAIIDFLISEGYSFKVMK